MKCLVTGGAGFIASHVVDALLELGNDVVIIDNLSTGKMKNINPSARLYECNIVDKEIEGIFEKEKPEIVFHFAAHIEARESVKDPIFDARINILGSLNILENCRKHGVRKIVFASSGGEIYGEADNIPTPEIYYPNPISPYGIAKLSVEKYLFSYYKMYGMDFVALRFGNVYGPRQNSHGEAGVIAIFINKMLLGEQPLIHGDGKQTKDYIFINDVVSAVLVTLGKDINEPVNVATAKETSVIEIFTQLSSLTDSNVEKKYVPLAPCSFPRGCLSIKKAEEILNWSPKYNLNQGLTLTVDWFKKNGK